MNVNAIKQKLASLQKTEKSSEEKGASLPKWKPTIGKQQIRVVPSKFDSDTPFTEMYFYYNIGKRKVIVSPLNFGEKDPIAEFAKKLRSANDKEQWIMSKKLDYKTRYFAPVIVRGEEEKGVQYWEFGKEIYETFLNYAADEEVGDFTDVLVGRDFKLTTVGPESTGTAYNKTTMSPTMKTLPLSTDSDEVEKWLEEQIDPKSAYKALPFETIKEALQEWLVPEGDEDEDEVEAKPAPKYAIKTPTPVKAAEPTQNKPKKKADEQFDDMFADDEEVESDLPF
jgi:hypothetical protein